MSNGDVDVEVPRVIDVHVCDDVSGACHDGYLRAGKVQVAEVTRTEDIPRGRHGLQPVAEMARHVMKHHGHLVLADASGRRGFEDVDSLFDVEVPPLAANDRLVVADDSQSPEVVIENVGAAAKPRVPGEARITAAQRVGRQLKTAPRQELRLVGRNAVDRYRARLLSSRVAGAGHQRNDDEETNETRAACGANRMPCYPV